MGRVILAHVVYLYDRHDGQTPPFHSASGNSLKAMIVLSREMPAPISLHAVPGFAVRLRDVTTDSVCEHRIRRICCRTKPVVLYDVRKQKVRETGTAVCAGQSQLNQSILHLLASPRQLYRDHLWFNLRLPATERPINIT